jgi:hypothetical protein
MTDTPLAIDDPVEILCAEVYDVWDDEDRARIRDALGKVSQAGWRIVKENKNVDYDQTDLAIDEEWEP